MRAQHDLGLNLTLPPTLTLALTVTYTFRCARNMRNAAHSPTRAGPSPLPPTLTLSLTLTRCQRNLLERMMPSIEAGKAWVRGAVVAQLATNTLWLAPRAYRRKGAAMDGSEAEEDQRYRNSVPTASAFEEREPWERAAELRYRVRELLRDASRGDSDDEFDEEDEYDFDEEEDDWDDDAAWDEDLAVVDGVE